jgi:hypothetical protein
MGGAIALARSILKFMPGCRDSLHLDVKKIDTVKKIDVKNFDTLAEFRGYIQVHTFRLTMGVQLSYQKGGSMDYSTSWRSERQRQQRHFKRMALLRLAIATTAAIAAVVINELMT